MVNLNNIRISKRIWYLLIIVITIYTLHTIYRNQTQKFINLRHLLQVSIDAVEAGGLEIVAIKHDYKIKNKGITKEGANESVTTADFNSNCAIIKGLKSVYPYLSIISEESDPNCDKVVNLEGTLPLSIDEQEDDWIEQSDITMWIDPLDATQEFTENLHEYVTVMACVAIKGKPIIGVIHKPFLKETYWAWVKRIKSDNLIFPKKEANKTPAFIVSRSHAGRVRNLIMNNFNEARIITAAGSGYKSLEVAKGNADVYLHVTRIKKWDICAANAILSALDGDMVTLENNQINYTDRNPMNNDGILATLGDINDYLSALGGYLAYH